MAQFVAPSAATDDTLRALVYAVKLMPRGLRSAVNKETRQLGNKLWRFAVDDRAQTKMDRLILAKGARVKPGNPMVLTAATSKRPLKGGGGLIPNEARWWEFGSDSRANKRPYDRRNRSGSGHHTVTRRTARQMPARKKNGRVIYQAAADMAPRITAMVVQVTVRHIHEAHRGEG